MIQLNDVDRWCIDQEYIGIEDTVERNIKIFHDYKQTHSYDDYVQLVRDEHTNTDDVRSITLVEDFLNSSTKVYHDTTMIGRIVLTKDNLQFMSYEGIGDEEYPVIDNSLSYGVTTEEVLHYYQMFDKYVTDGDYLLDTSRKNTIDDLYLRMIRNHYGIPKELQRKVVFNEETTS